MRAPKTRSFAQELKLVGAVRPLAEADLVVLAIPVGAMTRVLPEIFDLIPETTTVTDMGSTKAKVCAAVGNHPKRAQFVPSHPLAGTENSGPSAAKSNRHTT